MIFLFYLFSKRVYYSMYLCLCVWRVYVCTIYVNNIETSIEMMFYNFLNLHLCIWSDILNETRVNHRVWLISHQLKKDILCKIQLSFRTVCVFRYFDTVSFLEKIIILYCTLDHYNFLLTWCTLSIFSSV